MGETNEQPVETEVQTQGSAEALMEAEEMPDEQCHQWKHRLTYHSIAHYHGARNALQLTLKLSWTGEGLSQKMAPIPI
ncbi:hypothetical protein DAPPUDRAFT_332120 [Daphnia pulex]|uniref:Uncharacterized protein n=1 Tax=Daphnia pulex TaxID=6669 RepID=E9HP14_DAPPU|nr:hypothetical protein DAPPUDRAFT_332120 [Daphnia pulex]|eukprot:EFX66516.1 hypothetical protein DAPPUDRAFT_332120 [Daphnia pulex]